MQTARAHRDTTRLRFPYSPGTSALLKHNFFKKAGDSAYLATNLLSQIEDIGESSMTAGIADALPGFVRLR